MKAKTARRLGTALGCLAAFLIFALVATVSWAITCGLIKLITLCFGWTFSWSIATGIWMIFWLTNWEEKA